MSYHNSRGHYGGGGGGASHLAAIYGSEQDKVNCSFYLKIGACRHGDRCSRKHIKPHFSQTIVIQNMYQNPNHGMDAGAKSVDQLQDEFDQFFEDVYCELVKFGHLLEMHVCDNVGDHLIGNVYARYDFEDEAQTAIDTLNTRWFAGRPLFAELSPVTDFREATCRQNDLGNCDRGGFCNFHHLRKPRAALVKELDAQQRVERRVNPSQRDIERAEEMKMFATQTGTVPSAPKAATNGGDYDRRRSDYKREASPERRHRVY
ncbi:uncharacterized protein L969DRAFT_623136 [Mixia osmundae IAM 14324]|uniref:C3H1-type domain-containing protein n=1 Tax=Mixia osmundae (strain CBS 9802 / IAM 14324 / JCM 22182 / KY 12970) TaxID=764103 RepID=G7DVR8_MIXOS|nr:uncharacterized protein L969DRAFT_623136 [Mixia osmundae IAM 14324]KEI39641.1 hypothetical protein L969DRAFT_623136 [Mixia osmundae IAM 14324]GAA94678.1 hypothetical protein E5Q_01331 [Mixia osmundae IAM 14324]